MIDSQLREAVRLAGTPCYVFDARKLGYRVAFLREHLPSEIGLCYAMKANPFLLKEISPLVDRIEICSPGELTIAGKLDIPLKQYVVSGVNKDPERIQSMVSAGTIHASAFAPASSGPKGAKALFGPPSSDQRQSVRYA